MKTCVDCGKPAYRDWQFCRACGDKREREAKSHELRYRRLELRDRYDCDPVAAGLSERDMWE